MARSSALIPLLLLALSGALSACATAGTAGAPAAPIPPTADLREEVMATERAFAQTMADRDVDAFATFVAEDAIFFTGEAPLRGRAQVVEAWRRFYQSPVAPFSWEPESVEVLDSGALALSSGPVRDADGQLIARFTSIWRRAPDGRWEIVFDQGSPVCD